jgi:hypothetical protein
MNSLRLISGAIAPLFLVFMVGLTAILSAYAPLAIHTALVKQQRQEDDQAVIDRVNNKHLWGMSAQD